MTILRPDWTNDPSVRSWVPSANDGATDFPVQNLPFAEFRPRDGSALFRGGVAIGDQIVDLAALDLAHPFAGDAGQALSAAAHSTLNSFMQLGVPAWQALRRALFCALRTDANDRMRVAACLIPQSDAEFAVPARIGDYTDFYSSIHHATAVGRLFRPDNPLLPNYKWVPVGYHGRSSSIGISGQTFHRPVGQRLPPGASGPVVGPSERLDYELELGVFVGAANALGVPVPIADAEAHIFGLCLLNDWSARDLQAWEYQPLGPFLAKSFATTLSPWIVTLQALAPFRRQFSRPVDDPSPLAYLTSDSNTEAGSIDIHLEAWIDTSAMRARGAAPQQLSATSFRHSYWTIGQLLTHHTSNGCNLNPGDLLGTGTQSGPTPAEAGSLLELTVGGTRPIAIGTEESRYFLANGDRVTLRASCRRDGAVRIGFGEVSGTVSESRIP